MLVEGEQGVQNVTKHLGVLLGQDFVLSMEMGSFLLTSLEAIVKMLAMDLAVEIWRFLDLNQALRVSRYLLRLSD